MMAIKNSYQKLIYYTIWILGIAVLQSTLLQHIQIFRIMPNLFIIFIVCAAMLSGSPKESAIIGIILGFLFDFLTGHSIGLSALLFMYAGVLNGLIFERVLSGKYFGILPTVFATSLLVGTLYYVLLFTMHGNGNFGYALTRVILVESVYNTLICVPFFLLARKGYRRIVNN